jgi:amino acid adenylation domain-containing protein
MNREETTTISHDRVAYDQNTVETPEDYTSGGVITEEEQPAASSATQQIGLLDRCVPQLIENQSALTPDTWALVEDDYSLSYGEFNRRANQLAHYLRVLGVGPDTLVGLCMERSIDMVVGLLGILKAGAAYVPLDPAYPPERLTFMLKDANLSLIVTSQLLAAQFALQEIKIVCLDADAAQLAEQSTANPISEIVATDLAYVIYTSGSTGQPKGVQITHANLLNLVDWHQRTFAVTSSDRATQIASPAFDATGWELWPYLTTGASVSFVDEDTRIDPVMLRDWLVRRAITITFLPTPLAERVMLLEWPKTTSLRFLLAGGDALHSYPAPGLPFTLVNNYGPTEATVVATSGLIFPTEHSYGTPSIGRAIDNVQVYILDEHLQPVTAGEPGEIYIGGVSLAKGYLHRPELTAEKFIASPFHDVPNARLYKTGDLARYLPDGQIAFLGRLDHQVKIRGFRIELGEIEAALNRHPAIQHSVVVTREDIPEEKHLVAYVVPHYGQQVTFNELYSFLEKWLPDYMLPTTFVALETLPLTVNGKVDRAALPMPDFANSRVFASTIVDEVEAAPGTLVEEQVAEIISSVLGLEQVGPDENFFMLGGHSLLGTQVIMRIASTFGVEMPLRTLFNAPTARQLSGEVEQLIFAKLETMSEDDLRLLAE